MLLAYIDEIGETGAFVSKVDRRYNTSPAFGYAGLVIPEEKAREFGAILTREKRALFATDLKGVATPGQWERKGADIFRPATHEKYPQQIRVFNHLVRALCSLGGRVFYYADEKPIGTPAQIRFEPEERESAAMRESLNRLCSHAETQDRDLMVLIDQINESQRAKRLPNMYGHILSRAADREEMKRIVEPPMHVDSMLSANIQFADWIAAAITRAIEFQLLEDSAYAWVTSELKPLREKWPFTHESKLHLHLRSLPDFNGTELMTPRRRLFPPIAGQRVSASIDPAVIRRILGASQKPSSQR